MTNKKEIRDHTRKLEMDVIRASLDWGMARKAPNTAAYLLAVTDLALFRAVQSLADYTLLTTPPLWHSQQPGQPHKAKGRRA